MTTDIVRPSLLADSNSLVVQRGTMRDCRIALMSIVMALSGIDIQGENFEGGG